MKKHHRTIFSIVLLLSLALLGTALVATAQAPTQQPVDEALSAPDNEGPAPSGAEVPSGGTHTILDDFNRPDGPLSAAWTVQNGSCSISNNAAVCNTNGRATFNDAPGNGNFAEADVAVNGTSLQLTGLLLNYGDGITNLYLKVQQQSPNPGKFTHAACYIGTGGASFGLGFFPLTSQFATAHMSALRISNTVTLKFSNIDGGSQPDQTYICNDAPPPEGNGIGILGNYSLARLDNFGVGVSGITVEPLSLQADLVPDQTQTEPITICNVGDMPLNWNLFEVSPQSAGQLTHDGAGTIQLRPQIELSPGQMPSSNLLEQLAIPLNSAKRLDLGEPGALAEQTNGAGSPIAAEATAPEGVTTLLLDDGTGEELWGFYFGERGLIFLNRFSPDVSDYPFVLNEVRIFGGPAEAIFDLAFYKNTTASINPAWGAELIYTATATLQAYDTWNVYSVDPPLIFEGPGDVLIGLLPHSDEDGYYWWQNYVDTSIPQNRSWWGWWGDDALTSPPFLPPNLLWELTGPTVTAGNWMVRAYGQTIGTDIPWLHETPFHGMEPAGTCRMVGVRFDSTGLAVGDHHASLQINSNDPGLPMITIPITLTVRSPQIEVAPTSLVSVQPPNSITSKPVKFCNSGNADLIWTLAEFPGSPVSSNQASSGTIEWLYRDDEGVDISTNTVKEVLVYPSAYRWRATTYSTLKVLIFTDDGYHPSPNSFLDQALQHLGIPYTAYYMDFAGFVSALTSGELWDLVIFSNQTWPNPDWMAPLNLYIQGGGRAIVNTWTVSGDPGNALWSTMGVKSFTNDIDAPDPVYWWEPSHPFFNLPQDVPEFTTLLDSYIIDGQKIEPLAGFDALAGYTTPGPNTEQAVLIFGNNGRTVFRGFTDGENESDRDGDGLLDSVELWIDLFYGVALGVGGDIPWLSEDQVSGTVSPGACTEPQIAITFNSAGLAFGSFQGDIHVNSNDTFEPVVVIPVTLTVDYYHTFLPIGQKR